MADRRIVVDSLQLKYQGLVNVNEFYRIMDKWFREKGYDKYEKRTSEQRLNGNHGKRSTIMQNQL